jgi:AcrR family transcriptional regulator
METKDISAIKKKLLETAETLFSDKGYNGTTIREIARAAEVNLALVNYHFGSKENLYLTIFQRRFLAYQNALLKMEQNHGAAKKLDSFLDIYGSFIDTHRNFHRLLSRELTLLHQSAIKEVITNGTHKNFDLVKNIILDGIQSGIFKEVNVDLVALNIIAFVPRVFSGNPFIDDLFKSQNSQLDNKETLSTQLKEYFYAILSK